MYRTERCQDTPSFRNQNSCKIKQVSYNFPETLLACILTQFLETYFSQRQEFQITVGKRKKKQKRMITHTHTPLISTSLRAFLQTALIMFATLRVSFIT